MSHRRSILIVSPWSSLWSLGPGAGVSDESEMLSRFSKRGYDIHMLVPRTSDPMTVPPGIEVHSFANVLALPDWIPAPLRRLWFLPAFWTVAGRAAVRWARELRPDLVMGFSYYGARPAYDAARCIGVPSVLKLFGVMHAMRLEWPLPRYLYHSVETVLALKTPKTHFIILNDGTRGDAVARRWGVPPERITYLPNGIDKEWARLDLDRARLRASVGVTDGTIVFLSLSRLVQSKRVDRIVKAMWEMEQKCSLPVELWIAGDGPLRGSLEELSDSLGVSVRFVGTISHDRVPHYLDAADVFVSASCLTNMAIPTCEAMVMGTPVVALDVGGTRDVVRHEDTGLLAPEEDHLAFVDCLLRLAQDPQLRERLGSRAREFAARHFASWDERVASEIDTVERLIGKNQSEI